MESENNVTPYGRIRVTLVGRTPLLMNRLTVEKLKSQSRDTSRKYDVDAEARASAYITNVDGKEQLYVPADAVFGMMLGAASFYKIDRFPARGILAGTVRVEPEEILLGTDKYEVDLRTVNIKRQRVVRSRAKVPNWKITFYLVYDKSIKGNVPEAINNILVAGGKRVGLLDFRPARNGKFGTFTVEEFEVIG